LPVAAESETAEKMIEECRDNFGTDCKQQVDTELLPPESRRQQLIADCQNDFGEDCEQVVDTELEAEQLDDNRKVFRIPANEK
jgi:hypothetical protein